ncbi:RDD family protein [Spiroplasma diminutum]|uniref:RDD domain-containing protein n=1 Tax=Spiroplasma diminutum CUAS-1 TaxID=1276221 RepID=S5MEI1_9MOLU|nr:RDD family protein [Spiroplasma diminutum]AGR42163.1 hypothetical protein SDIMI_v3c04590 [Spiroplasma diminutum CUAS-1]
MNAGFWRRVACNLIDNFLIGITLGIYWIFMIINFCMAKPSIGMKAMGMSYSTKKQLRLFGFSLLQALLYILIIPGLYDLVMICMKKGTFAERWSGNFLVIS